LEHTDILISLRKILRSVNIESKRIEKKHGLSVPQYLCLAFLVKRPGYKATLKEVKEHLVLNASTVTGIVARLEKKGLAVKLPNNGDRRSSDIVLTALGKDSIEAIPTLFHEKLSLKLKNLPKDELLELQNSLDLIVKIMEVENVDASPIIVHDQEIEAKN
jgi:DNA-binding MarR family transcriptional regulator